MEFSLGPALVSGFVATLVMTAMIQMSRAMGMTRMPSFELLTGSMFTGDEKKAKVIGAGIHYIMMGTIVFPVIYALIFNAVDSASWLTGLVVGVIHGAIVGGVFMPMMPMMHPRMHAGDVTPSGGLVMSAPGFMGVQWGAMTPVGVLMGHMIYGVVLALVYDGLVG